MATAEVEKQLNGDGNNPGAMRRFVAKFTILFGAARELWVTFGIKFLGVLAYAIANSTLVLWLSYDLGYDDVQAGFLVFGWSAAMTLFTVMVGSFTDAIGLRKAFLLGVIICILARAFMTFTTIKWMALGLGLIPLAIGEALGTPVLVAAVRRYSTTAQRSISFAMFYAIMNLAFFISSFIFDWIREGMGEPHGVFVIPGTGIELTTYRTLFLVSFIVEITILPLIWFGIREGAEATDEGLKITPEVIKYPDKSFLQSLRLTSKDALQETFRIFRNLWQQAGFYKFLAFLALAAFVRLIFIQMYYTYPKFGIRELGPGAPIGRLWSINAILIIFLVPLVGAISQRISAYRMVTFGSAIAAASVFIMAMPVQWFEPLAQSWVGDWLGRGWLGLETDVINPWYIMIFLFVVLLSIGEAIYSPRLYEYAAAIAPKGQEASYMSISYLPFFGAKLLVAGTSGYLLKWFCPEDGPRSSGTLWLIIAFTTLVCPVGLVALRKYIKVKEAGRDD